MEPEYAGALARRDADMAQAETERRLAAMETRVREADARARQAEAEAKEAQRDNRRRRYVYYAPPYGRPYHYPVCPPTTVVTRTALPYVGGSYLYGTFGSPYVQRESSIQAPGRSSINIRYSH